jgi:hypothetical protein
MAIARARSKLLAATALVVWLASASMAFGQFPPAAVVSAARSGLAAFLSAGDRQGLMRLGFRRESEIDQAMLGEGFQVFTIAPDRLLKTGAADGPAMAVGTSLWQFLVVSDHDARATLTIDRMNGEWLAVSLGASGVADQLMAMVRRYPTSTGFQLRLVRVYQASADLVEVSQSGTVAGLVPLVSARVALGLPDQAFDAADLRPWPEVAAGLRPVVARAMQAVR